MSYFHIKPNLSTHTFRHTPPLVVDYSVSNKRQKKLERKQREIEHEKCGQELLSTTQNDGVGSLLCFDH